MEFSRQEYWSGVPLPSPNQETRVVAKNYLLESISKEKWFCEDLGSGSETSVNLLLAVETEVYTEAQFVNFCA